MAPASELLCRPCIDELGITMLVAVAAIRAPEDEGLCVRCKRPIPAAAAQPAPTGS